MVGLPLTAPCTYSSYGLRRRCSFLNAFVAVGLSTTLLLLYLLYRQTEMTPQLYSKKSIHAPRRTIISVFVKFNNRPLLFLEWMFCLGSEILVINNGTISNQNDVKVGQGLEPLDLNSHADQSVRATSDISSIAGRKLLGSDEIKMGSPVLVLSHKIVTAKHDIAPDLTANVNLSSSDEIRIVVATSASESCLALLLEMITMLRRSSGNITLVVFDLGLSKTFRSIVADQDRNTEIRRLNRTHACRMGC